MPDQNFLVALKQLRESEISVLISGLAALQFTGLANAFSEYSKFVYRTGDQTISGVKTFDSNPVIPYTGGTGTAVSLKYILDREAVLQNNINVLTTGAILVAHLSGRETFYGEKSFESIVINSGRATGRLEVPYPVNTSGAVSVEYLTNSLTNLNAFNVFTSGDQWISGIKYFTDNSTVYLPVAVDPSGGVPLSQLTVSGNDFLNRITFLDNDLQNQIDNLSDLAALTTLTGITGGYAGVLSIDGGSGALFLQGRGTVTTVRVNNILNISGHSLNAYTGAFLGYTELLSGTDRQFISYGKTYEVTPYVFTQLESPSGNPFVTHYVSGRATDGFNVIYSTALTKSGYGLSYIGWTGSGSIINTVRGEQGLVGPTGQTGPIGNFVNQGTITGNFVNLTFFIDPVFTGLSVAEAFSNNSFIMTGFALSCTTTGRKLINSAPLSGNLYQRGQDSQKFTIIGFQFQTGVHFAVSGGYSTVVTGLNRIGLDITNTLSGIRGFSVGVFGINNVS